MTPQELAADLRTRINPIYADQLGTESHERRLCAEAIESLVAELARLENELTAASLRIDNDKAELEQVQEALKTTFLIEAELRAELERINGGAGK